MKPASPPLQLTFKMLTPSRFADFESLFGERGACGGCWCMFWRASRTEFEANKGEGNRRAMQSLVESGGRPGVLAYADGSPIGWCSFAPRTAYPALARSRILKPVDSQPVWSVSCLFVHKDWRRRGVSVSLLKAAARQVAKEGGRILEGYPVEPKQDKAPPAFIWTGTASAYLAAGFEEVARRSKTRPIMRSLVGK